MVELVDAFILYSVIWNHSRVVMADMARTLQLNEELALIRLAHCARQFYLVSSRSGYIILAHRLNVVVRYINTHFVRKRCDAVCISSMYAMIGRPPKVLHKFQRRVARFSTSHEAFEEARSVASTVAAAAVAIVLGHSGMYRVMSPT